MIETFLIDEYQKNLKESSVFANFDCRKKSVAYLATRQKKINKLTKIDDAATHDIFVLCAYQQIIYYFGR